MLLITKQFTLCLAKMQATRPETFFGLRIIAFVVVHVSSYMVAVYVLSYRASILL